MRLRLLSLSLLFVLGCEEDPSGPKPDPGVPIEDQTPEALVGSLRAILKAKDLAGYAEILSADFRFEFAPADIVASGEPSGIWTRERELLAITNMFTEEPSDQGWVISSIDLNFIARSPGWIPAAQPELVGMLGRIYALDMRIVLASGDVLQADGELDFYVFQTQDGFRFGYCRDLGVVQSREAPSPSWSWGALKSQF